MISSLCCSKSESLIFHESPKEYCSINKVHSLGIKLLILGGILAACFYGSPLLPPILGTIVVIPTLLCALIPANYSYEMSYSGVCENTLAYTFYIWPKAIVDHLFRNPKVLTISSISIGSIVALGLVFIGTYHVMKASKKSYLSNT